jgi:hypothetical protein
MFLFFVNNDFFLKVICSLTSSFYSTATNNNNNNNNNEEPKTVEDLECLFILGKHYTKPISNKYSRDYFQHIYIVFYR